MHTHPKRDLKFWEDKYAAIWQKMADLNARMLHLTFYASYIPKRRTKGFLRTTYRHSYWPVEKSTPYLTNKRTFNYRSRAQWKARHNRWKRYVTMMAVTRKRLKMLETTKLPYYRERIKSLGGTLKWG